MEKGNEGDEIIFLSLRQIEFPIPPTINSVAQLSADQIVEILARSLLLISNGEVKFPLTLPTNIATRHRICTSIAQKIKELGYLSDCGYNQLLYPMETQTRELLTWVVEKLPRSEEESAEEVLGANALLNRKITSSLITWKSAPRKLPVCLSKRPAQRPNDGQRYRTPSVLFSADNKKTVSMFRLCNESKLFVESSIFERNYSEIVSDAIYAAKLESELHSLDSLDLNGNPVANAKGGAGGANSIKNSVRSAISQALQSNSALRGGGEDGGASGGSGNSAVSDLEESQRCAATQLGLSLQDLIQSVTESYGSATASSSSSSSSAADGSTDHSRGTRFSHAIEFAQESTKVAATLGAAGGITGTGAGAAPGRTAKLGGLSASLLAGLDDGASDAAARKSAKEVEEAERQEELELLRSELSATSTSVDDTVRSQGLMTSKIRQFESDLSKLTAETEALERDIIIKRKTLEMLPSAAENIKKLQTIVSGSSARLMQLAQEWESHRRPLVEKLRNKKGNKAKRRAKCRTLVDEMKKCREDMISMIQDLKDKQDRAQVLTEEMGKLPKNINRAIYTHRIMDITASIVKQNKDIAKITQDIRDIQKTINLSSSTLSRADAITEDLIFTAANDKNDPVMVDTYRRLRTLRAKFDELTTTVSKIGQQEKLARDLETKVDQERARISTNNFDRISADLDSILKENAQLVVQIKQATAKANK